MPQFRRHAAAVAAASTLILALAACHGAVTAPGTGSPEAVAPAARTTALPEVYGTCDGVPAAETAGLPVAEALARSPQLARLSAAITGLPVLPSSLATEPELTVYAPTDAAFDELERDMGKEAFGALLADADRLDGLLSYHVTAKRLDAGQLAAAGKTTQLAHGDVTVGGTPDDLILTGTGGTTAGVVCGNVRTADAIVFVVDHVLLPATF